MPLTGVIRYWIEASVSHPLGLNIVLLKVDVGGFRGSSSRADRRETSLLQGFRDHHARTLKRANPPRLR